MSKQRQLFILIGPSGSGKNTVLRNILDLLPDIVQMPTATTRSRRPNEINGREHFFFSESEFDKFVEKGELAEWQRVHGNLYGTMKSVLVKGFSSENDFIADLEVLGAQAIKELHPDNVVLIFLTPPTLDILESRIKERGQVSDDEISIRLSRVKFELGFVSKCDYLVVNDELSSAIEQVKGIILAERCRRQDVDFEIEKYT